MHYKLRDTGTQWAIHEGDSRYPSVIVPRDGADRGEACARKVLDALNSAKVLDAFNSAAAVSVPKGWAVAETSTEDGRTVAPESARIVECMAPAHPAFACGLTLPLHVPAFGDPLEHAITRGLIVALTRAGFVPVAVWDSEEYQMADGRSVSYRETDRGRGDPHQRMTVAEVLDAVFSVDAISTIHFAPRDDLKAWGGHGVMVVPGNGVDFISDYHSHKGAWTDALEAFTDAITDNKAHAFVIVTGADIEVAKS